MATSFNFELDLLTDPVQPINRNTVTSTLLLGQTRYRLGDQVAGTMTRYPTQAHYSDTVITSPCPILLMLSTRLGIATSINCISHWFDSVLPHETLAPYRFVIMFTEPMLWGWWTWEMLHLDQDSNPHFLLFRGGRTNHYTTQNRFCITLPMPTCLCGS